MTTMAPTETTRNTFAVVNDIGTIGIVHRQVAGPYNGQWFFIPRVSGRTGSRKGHPTADGAVPRWAKKMGGKLI